jgi:hypothetical protein
MPDVMSIEEVSPYYLSACQETVSIAITGVNVWRSTRVMLAGVESSGVKILPDMEGVLATFEMKKVYGDTTNTLLNTGARHQYMPLTVWTREGKDETAIPVYGWRGVKDGKPICRAQESVASVTPANQFRIHNVTPSETYACGKDVTFYVKLEEDDFENDGRQAQKLSKTHFTLDGVPARSAGRVEKKDDNTPIYRVTFGGTATAKGEARVATLSASDGDSSSAASVELLKCQIGDQKPNEGSTAGSGSEAAPSAPKLGAKYVVDANAADDAVKLAFTIAHSDKADFNDEKFRLGVLPATAPRGSAWILGARAPKPAESEKKKSTAIVEFGSKGNEAVWDDFNASGGAGEKLGAKIKVAIVDKSGKRHAAAHDLGEIAFYPRESDRHVAKILKSTQLEPDQSVSGELRFPKHAAAAYPGIESFKLAAHVNNDRNIALSVTPDSVAIGADGAMKFSIKYGGSGKREPIKTDDIILSFGKGDAPLKIE